MGNRDVYFEKHIRPQKTPEAYLKALMKSPYRLHQRMAITLTEEYKKLREAHEQSTKKDSNRRN